MDNNVKAVSDNVENKVIKEACTAFLLNAWRHRRQEVAEIKKKIVVLENQVIFFLRLEINLIKYNKIINNEFVIEL